MSAKNPNTYIITFSNYFEFEGRILAFRKQNLFDITDTPKYIEYSGSYWLVKRKQLTISKIKDLIVKEPKKVDITGINWYRQEQINHCVNLDLL